MKQLQFGFLPGLLLTAAVLLAGCQAAPAQTAEAPAPSDSASMPPESASPALSPSAAPTPMEPSPLPELKDITFDDQKQVEQLISTYFTALETKDDEAAWNLLSERQQEDYPLDRATKEHFGFDAVKLVSIKGILPPRIAETLPPYQSRVTDAPPGTPTIWFQVELDVTPATGSSWDKGDNTRFVNAIKDGDGIWRIDGLTTSP